MLTTTSCPSYEFVPPSCGCHRIKERAKISRAFATQFCLGENGETWFLPFSEVLARRYANRQTKAADRILDLSIRRLAGVRAALPCLDMGHGGQRGRVLLERSGARVLRFFTNPLVSRVLPGARLVELGARFSGHADGRGDPRVIPAACHPGLSRSAA